MTQTCPKCGTVLQENARFCEQCGTPVPSSSTQPSELGRSVPVAPPGSAPATPPAPQSAFNPAPGSQDALARKQPNWIPCIIGGCALTVILVILLAAGGLLLWQPWSNQLSRGAVTYVVVTSAAPQATSGAATPAPTDTAMAPTDPSSAIPTAANVAVLPTTPTPSPAAPTDTLAPTRTPPPSAAPAYDLYVKRVVYQPGPSSLVAGKPVQFAVLVVTDIHPTGGPLFPATRLRWRAADSLGWQEAFCQADTHYSMCNSTFEFTYSQAGTFQLSVEVDPLNEVAETDETNNTSHVTLEVQARAPTAVATAKPAGLSLSAVTFSSAFDEDQQLPVNPGKAFPYGVTIIYAYWTYSSAIPGTPFEYDWYRDGVRVDGSGENLVTGSGKAFQWHNYGFVPKDPLSAGNYRFSVRVNGQVVLSDTFVIQPPQVGGPIAGAISVFFSVQNGNPTSWVYDKQGAKHSPQYGTISGIHVSPGDRIVLQTDQSRFSLLFDCSTSAGTFNPCDFSADSTANLPKEIRAIKSGMNGYLNISRADNWAGYRPGFEPQRYPADPVLRIVFEW